MADPELLCFAPTEELTGQKGRVSPAIIHLGACPLLLVVVWDKESRVGFVLGV